ncbi:MAG: peptidoglycan-binding protein, partial [Bryobacteraceae bacterium]
MGTDYTVQQGDCLSSIAEDYGFSDYQTIYLRPENAAFREKRPNPNVIFPGDVLYIPDREIKKYSRPTDRRHRFVLKRPKVLLRLCLKDDLHQPYKNAKYCLRVGFDQYQGATDGGGIVEHEIPAGASEGEITIFPRQDDPSDEGYTFSLTLGELDPVDETSGVDARLINLGFGPPDGPDSGFSDEDRTEALKAFQDRFGLDVTGEADEATRTKLRQLHDAE